MCMSVRGWLSQSERGNASVTITIFFVQSNRMRCHTLIYYVKKTDIFGPGSEKWCFWKENKLQQINFPADRGITVNCLQLSLAANPVDSALAFMGGRS